MADTDAFGNKVEKENASTSTAPAGAAEAAGISASDSPATPTPSAPTAPSAPPASTGLTLSGRPSRFGGAGGPSLGRWVGVLILLGVIGVGVAVAINATNDAKRVINSFTQPALTVAPDTQGNSGDSSTNDSSTQPDKPVPDPVGLGPRSLIRADHFGAAMAKLRRAHLGHVKYVRVSPAQINLQLVTDSGRIRTIAVGVLGDVHQLGSLSGPGFSTADTIPFSHIDAGAPERLVRGGVRHGGVRANGIEYLVGMKFGDQVVWNAFFKNNVRYQGDQSGNVQGKF